MVSSRDFGLGFERPTLATEMIGEQARAHRSGGGGAGGGCRRRLCQPQPRPTARAAVAAPSHSALHAGEGRARNRRGKSFLPSHLQRGKRSWGRGRGWGGERGLRRAGAQAGLTRGCQLPRLRPAVGPGGRGQTPWNGGRSGKAWARRGEPLRRRGAQQQHLSWAPRWPACFREGRCQRSLVVFLSAWPFPTSRAGCALLQTRTAGRPRAGPCTPHRPARGCSHCETSARCTPSLRSMLIPYLVVCPFL